MSPTKHSVAGHDLHGPFGSLPLAASGLIIVLAEAGVAPVVLMRVLPIGRPRQSPD